MVETGSNLGRVGVVSASEAGLAEIAHLLHQEHVTLSHRIYTGRKRAALLNSLRTCQDDTETEIILLLSPSLPPEGTRRLLDQVRRSEKPTVACLLGTDPRLLWRSGAIPAARLDEAALRAIAWVRGWDQALISSQLEDLDEQMETLAQDVHLRLDPARRRLRGLFTSEIFYREAQTVLAGLAVPPARMTLSMHRAPAERADRLRAAGAKRDTGILLLDVVLGREPVVDLAAALPPARDNRAIIAYVSGSDAAQRAAQEEVLRRAGVLIAPSSAAAAHLAGQLAIRGVG